MYLPTLNMFTVLGTALVHMLWEIFTTLEESNLTGYPDLIQLARALKDLLRKLELLVESGGVTRKSAYFVDNIHTDIAFFGTSQSKGHLDFFTGVLEVVYRLFAGYL